MSHSTTFALLTADAELAESCQRAADGANLRVIVASDCGEAARLFGTTLGSLEAFLIDVDTVPYASAWLSALEQAEARLRVIAISRYHPRFCQAGPPQGRAKQWLRKPVRDEEILATLACGDGGEGEDQTIEALTRRGRL